MTTVVNRGVNDRGGSAHPAPAPAPIARLPRRRRWGLFALGVVLVALGAVVAYLLVVTAGVTRPYLAVTHKVPYGATIRADDLTVVDVNPAAGLKPIPADQRDRVVGKHAAADLFPGTLLTGDQLTDMAIPAPGQQLVGIEQRKDAAAEVLPVVNVMETYETILRDLRNLDEHTAAEDISGIQNRIKKSALIANMKTFQPNLSLVSFGR